MFQTRIGPKKSVAKLKLQYCKTILPIMASFLLSFQTCSSMYRFSIFIVVAVIAVAGEALSLVENPWDTTSDLLASSSRDLALAVQDVTDDAGVNSPPDMMAADVPCSPSSNDQGRKKQSSKVRRGQACPLDRSWDKTTPPNAQDQQEQGQQLHQISNPDNTDNISGANKAASSDFDDDYQICNPMLVGLNRKVPVCDSGRVLDRSIYQGRIDYVENIMTGGLYTLLDVAPGIYHLLPLPSPNSPPCI